MSRTRCLWAVRLCLVAVVAVSAEGRIINDKEAEIGEVPYQISLQRKNNEIFIHRCSGAIINKFFAITTAHCVVGLKGKDLTIVTDTNNLKVGGTRHNVVDIIVHKDYNATNFWLNDIALLKTETPFDASLFDILPEPFKNPKEGREAIVSGWGITEKGTTLDRLQKATMYITEQEKCKNIYQAIHSSQICANNSKQITGAFNADSGSPLTVDNKLVGIVSWSGSCTTPEYPTVFTRVSHYIDWILEHVTLVRPTL